MNFKTIIFSISLIAGLSACQKENPFDPNQSNGTKVNKSSELSIPSDFDWKTQHQISLQVSPTQNGVLQVLDAQGNLLFKGMAYAGKPLNIPFIVSAADSQIEVVFKGQREKLTLNNSGILTSKVK